MRLVLDTNVLVEVEHYNKEMIAKLKVLTEKYPTQPATTFMNIFECLEGFKRVPKLDKEKMLFLDQFPVFHTTQRTAYILADLKVKYEGRGLTIPLADMIIAALVIEHEATLITMDKGFQKIEELEKIFI